MKMAFLTKKMINAKCKAVTMVNSITSRQETGEIQVISGIF